MDANEIKSIEELKKLKVSELSKEAELIRQYIINNVSKTGGHLSSNLGVVEMTIALHYVFDSPFDKLIFDVGHQDYAHKILTGRSDKFDKLRKKDGLSGFPSYNESEHDVWESGHSSTSIGASIGFLEAKKMNNEKIGSIVSIIGDGAFANGLALSSLNYLAENRKDKVIIILNDNEMSIGKNVGGIAKKFSEIRIQKSYQLFRKFTFRFVREGFKALIYHHNIFTSLGLKYLGPIDGHDIPSMVKYFTYAKNYNETIVLHVKTKKGKGYPYSEQDEIGAWHGVGPFDIETGKALNQKPQGKISWSELVGEELLKRVEENPKIEIITPAMTYGCGLEVIKEKYPKRIIDVGINEELAVLIGASLSRNETIPIVSIYSTFIQRAYDELNNDVNRTNNHVLFLLDRSGIVPNDGSTHQGIYDLAMINHLNNFTITMPSNKNELVKLLDYGIEANNPFVIRYPKALTDNASVSETIDFGKWKIIKKISDINIITYGNDVNEFNEEIKDKEIGLINALFIKPIDTNLIDSLNGKKVIIYEQVIENGSLGESVLKYIYENNLNINLKRYFIDGTIKEGTTSEIKDQLGLNIKEIVKSIS